MSDSGFEITPDDGEPLTFTIGAEETEGGGPIDAIAQAIERWASLDVPVRNYIVREAHRIPWSAGEREAPMWWRFRGLAFAAEAGGTRAAGELIEVMIAERTAIDGDGDFKRGAIQ
jgi:hypothetical protein